MRVIFTVLPYLLFSSISLAQGTIKLEEATILGQEIKLGQGADIVQSRIKADRFVTSGYNYGDESKGYYIDNGITYTVTYGPPKSGTGVYVVQQIEKVTKQENISKVSTKPAAAHTTVNFDTSESELKKKFPNVTCEQMPNPEVRMCTLAVENAESISYLFYSDKLININGRTKN